MRQEYTIKDSVPWHRRERTPWRSRFLPALRSLSLLLTLLAQSSPSLFVVIRSLVLWVAVAKLAFVVDRLCKANSGRKRKKVYQILKGELREQVPYFSGVWISHSSRTTDFALIPAGLKFYCAFEAPPASGALPKMLVQTSQ